MDFKSDKSFIHSDYCPLVNYQASIQKPQHRFCWYAVGYAAFTVAVVALLIAGLIKRGVL